MAEYNQAPGLTAYQKGGATETVPSTGAEESSADSKFLSLASPDPL